MAKSNSANSNQLAFSSKEKAEMLRGSDYVIQAAKKRADRMANDPFGFQSTKEERAAISPQRIAYDVIGNSFFTMTEAQRNYIVELVSSGDLTSSEIAEAAKSALPYDPRKGFSEQELTRLDPRGLRMSEDQRSMPVKEMSQKEFYKTFFGYDYEEEEIPQKVREIYSGLTGMPVDTLPKTKDNLPKGKSYHPDYLSAFQQQEQKIALAQGGNVRFFNPDPISYEQYSKGPVDFYNQALDTSSGINVDTINEQEDKSSDEDNNQSQSPNIFQPIGSDNDDSADNSQNVLEYTIGSDGAGFKAAANVTAYGLDDINFGNTDTSKNTYTFTSPIGTLDAATGKYSNPVTMDLATGDMNFSFSSMFNDYQSGSKAADAAQKTQMSSGPNLNISSYDKFTDSVSKNMSAVFGPITVDTRPYGDKPSAISPGAAGAPAGVGMGILATAFGGLNMAQQARNAAAFQATSGTGGALMDIDGTMVSRMPGEASFFGYSQPNKMGGMNFNYVGNLQGRTQYQMAALEARKRGYVPGTLRETYNEATKLYERTGVKSEYMSSEDMARVGGTYDPKTGSFIDLNGNSSLMGWDYQAEAYVSGINARFGSTLSASAVSKGRATARAKGIDFQTQMESDAVKSAVNATGLSFHKINSIRSGNFLVSGTGGSEAGLNDKGFSTFSDFRGDSETADNAPATTTVTSDEVKAEIDAAFEAQYNPNPGSDNNNEGPAEDGYAYGETDFYKLGGRVGMQEGGPAGFAERPEFVGGNQRPTDQQSIADDVPREVQEGTFVINSAAADQMGRDDVEKMLRQAYQKAGESGMGAGQQGMSQEVAIAVSRGEVTIPPHIAKIIGYDRLKKINNRGKKEVSRRQQEREQAAGGGFISRKKLAKGDRVTVYRGEPLDPAKVTPTDYGYGKENVGKYHTTDVKKAGRFAAGSGKGNQVIKSRKVTIDEMFNGVKDGFKMEAKKDTEYFAKMPKSELNKNLRFVDSLKKAYLAGERSLDDIAFFLQDQVFHDDKSKINFIETFKNDPKSAGKLAGRAIVKVATVATPPLAVLASAAEMLTPSSLGKGTLYDDSFMSYKFTPKVTNYRK